MEAKGRCLVHSLGGDRRRDGDEKGRETLAVSIVGSAGLWMGDSRFDFGAGQGGGYNGEA